MNLRHLETPPELGTPVTCDADRRRNPTPFTHFKGVAVGDVTAAPPTPLAKSDHFAKRIIRVGPRRRSLSRSSMESMRSGFRSRCTSYRPSRSSFSGLSASPNACSRSNGRFANCCLRVSSQGSTSASRKRRNPSASAVAGASPSSRSADRGRVLRTAFSRSAGSAASAAFVRVSAEGQAARAHGGVSPPRASFLCGSGPATAGGHPTCDPAMVWPCRESRCPAARTGRLRHRRGRRSSSSAIDGLRRKRRVGDVAVSPPSPAYP